MGSAHFLNIQRQFWIIDGHPSRQLFLTKTTGCRSWDGEIGRTVESGYKEEKPCSECKYKWGYTDEATGEKIKCKTQYTLIFEHEDPEQEYNLTISYGAQKNLEQYAIGLEAQGIEIDQVITGITRIENIKTAGTTYTFKKVGDLDLKVEPEEKAALAMLMAKAVKSGPIPIEFAVTLLMNLASLDGLGEDRAQRLAESIAEDGMITGKTN